MSNEKMWEEFEVWLRTRPEVLNIGFNKETGRYLLCEDQERWEAWQASRADLAIELPPSGSDVDKFWKDDVIHAIESIGLKVTL